MACERLLQLLLELIITLQLNAMTEFLYHETRCVLINHLVNGCHDTELHQLFNHHTRFHRHLLRKITHANVFWQLDVVNNFLGRLLEGMLVRLIAATSPLTAARTPHP